MASPGGQVRGSAPVKPRRSRRSRTETNDASSPRATTRDELLDAAERAIRRTGPETSMDDLAAEAGITKPILYRHFGDKGGLYRALAERYLLKVVVGRRAIVGEVADPEERVRATIDGYISLVERDPDVYRFLAHHALRGRPETDTPLSAHIRTLATDIADEIRDGLGRIDGDGTAADPWAYGIIGFIQSATDWWLEERPLPRDQFVNHLVALLWAGLSQGKVRTS